MGGPLAILAGQALRDRAPKRCGELRRELAFSGRPANPPPPSGESEEEGGDAESDVFPAPAPQPMTYIRPMGGGPLAPLAGQALRDRAPKRCGELRRELAFSERPANPPSPSGESEEEGGDAEGDASPAPAPQPTTYIRLSTCAPISREAVAGLGTNSELLSLNTSHGRRP